MANNQYKNKVVYNGTTLIDLTGDTVTAANLAQGVTAHDASGAPITGTMTGGAIIISDTTDVHGGTIREITAQEVVNLQSGKSVTPTESAQIVEPDTGYDAFASVNVGAISSTYVGSGITQRSSSDLSASGSTVTVPSGYYSSQATKSVASGTAGTPTATKGAVSNHSVSVTPSVTNTTGYITGSTKTGTAVTVSASELVSGSQTITENDTYDVTNLAEIVVDVASGGIDIPVMTVTQQSSGEFQTISCNKTYNECYTVYRNDSHCAALVSSYTYSPTNIRVNPMWLEEDFIDGAFALLFFNYNSLEHSIVYKSNGTLVEYDLSDW